MRKRNQDKNESQFEFNFQADNSGFSKEEKELNSLVQSAGVSKAEVSEKVQSASTFKAKLVQKAPTESLSKKSSEDKIKNITCNNKPTGLLFENLITIEELAVIFRLAPQTIRNWIALGKIPYVRIGRRSFFQQRSLQKWLNQKEEPQWQ